MTKGVYVQQQDAEDQADLGGESRVDTQVVEIIGRNWLVNELVKARLEVATPIRDHGIDLIAYVDNGEHVQSFAACPVQMKAASKRSFAVRKKFGEFPNLLLAYVWDLDDPSLTTTYALTYGEAVGIADAMGWTATPSWNIYGGYSTSNPNKELVTLLSPFVMTPERWRKRVLQLTQRQDQSEVGIAPVADG